MLRQENEFKQIERALKAYLRHRGGNATPYMYELLAVSLKRNGGDVNELATALGWAARLAYTGDDWKQMTSVADLMNINKLDALTVVDAAGKQQRTSIGDLLDRAMDKAPHSERPFLMAINYAYKKRDPERLASSVDRLMSIGWPGRDEVFRIEARRLVEDLASQLEREGKHGDAQKLLDRLAQSESRDLYLRLSWTGDADLDLVVDEPLGATASWFEPRTVFGGAIVKNGYGKYPEDVYVLPRGFDGDYKARVRTIYNDAKDPARVATLEIISHEGTPQEKRETRTIRLDKPEPVVITLQGGRRKEVLPYLAPALKPKKPAKADAPASRPAAPAAKPARR